MERWIISHKAWLVVGAGLLVLATIGAGFYLKHYFVVTVFAVWLTLELTFWRVRLFTLARSPRTNPLQVRPSEQMASLIILFSASDLKSAVELEEKLSELRTDPNLRETEKRFVNAMRDLMMLRGLLTPRGGRGRSSLREAFLFRASDESRALEAAVERDSFYDVSLQDVTEAGMQVADLLERLHGLLLGKVPELIPQARILLRELIGAVAETPQAFSHLDKLADAMRRHGGIPFLVLNLIRNGHFLSARQLGQNLLGLEGEMEEEIRSSMYWISEVFWFTHEKTEAITDHETTIRYLYHLCFTNPDRAGFLEVDSQFFSQFETINELAQEAFLFKETLVEKVLESWKEFDGLFDSVFQRVLESMTRQQSKIYDERVTWERYWEREQEAFSREYLYVVEANISFAAARYEDARMYYEKALKINPELRPALLNLVFCYARLGLKELHEAMVERLMENKALLPASLYTVANSYLLLGKDGHSEVYYQELKKQRGWERKTEYYRSTFCFENGLFEKALEFARKAHEINPEDSSIRYHLSVCYNAVGEKNSALDLVKGMGDAPEWMNYYKFTLQRDAGHPDEACKTLLGIPSDYFQDPDELEQALEFARGRKDLVLLRHLRQRA